MMKNEIICSAHLQMYSEKIITIYDLKIYVIIFRHFFF